MQILDKYPVSDYNIFIQLGKTRNKNGFGYLNCFFYEEVKSSWTYLLI